jgi:hypothetical protein
MIEPLDEQRMIFKRFMESFILIAGLAIAGLSSRSRAPLVLKICVFNFLIETP